MARYQSVHILYCDHDICVCVKPAGLACETARASDFDLIKILKRQFYLEEIQHGKQRQANHEFFPVHRLDQPVGGIMVLATNAHAAAVLGEQIRNHAFQKHYLAVAYPITEIVPETAALEDFLIYDLQKNVSRICPPDTPHAKKATLHYQILKFQTISTANSEGSWKLPDYEYLSRCPVGAALVKIALETGRHHQIRVQLCTHGLPLMYDQKYNPAYRQTADRQNVALFSSRLEFFHPSSKKLMCFEQLPENGAFALFQ